jgi:hypothetical protein
MGYGRTSLFIFHYDMLSVANKTYMNALAFAVALCFCHVLGCKILVQ